MNVSTSVSLRKTAPVSGQTNKRKKVEDETLPPHEQRSRAPPAIRSVHTVMASLKSSVQCHDKKPGVGMMDHLKCARSLAGASKENVLQSMQHGAIPVMYQILEKYPHFPLAVAEALHCLSNLAFFSEGSKAIVLSGGIDRAVPLVTHPSPLVIKNALWLIAHVALESNDHRVKLLQYDHLLKNVFYSGDENVLEASAFATKALLLHGEPPQLLLESVTHKVIRFFVQAVAGNNKIEIVSELMQAFAYIVHAMSKDDVAHVLTKDFVHRTILGALRMAGKKKEYTIYRTAALLFREAVQVDGVGAHFVGTTFLADLSWFTQRSGARRTTKSLIAVLEGLAILSKAMGTADTPALFANLPDDLVTLLQYSSVQPNEIKKRCIKLLSIVFCNCNRAVFVRFQVGVQAMCRALDGCKDIEQIVDTLQCFVCLVQNHELVDLQLIRMIDENGGMAAVDSLIHKISNNNEVFRLGSILLDALDDDDDDDFTWDDNASFVDQNDVGLQMNSDTSKLASPMAPTAFGGTSFQNGM